MRGAEVWSRRRLVAAVLAAASAALALPATGSAAVTAFGSQLSIPATKDTAADLSYRGTDVAVPGSVFHIPHDGADTALWNGGQPAPASGQILSLRLEGCASQAAGAPPPLTEIHFQDLVSQPGGGVKVNVTTQAFNLPVCGQGGANGSTVTTFSPTNFCVTQGDYVDFNDEGGFVPSSAGPPPYPSGVPYLVIGSVAGSTMGSFIRNNGVGNGAMFSPSDVTSHDGFAFNHNEELLLQATLATGPDATPLCPGGTQGAQGSSGGAPGRSLPAVRLGRQTVGVNRSRIASVAIYCRPPTGCRGVMTLNALGVGARAGSRAKRAGVYGSTTFNLTGNKTGHVPIRVNPQLIAALRKRRRGVPVNVTATAGTTTVSQTIILRIF